MSIDDLFDDAHPDAHRGAINRRALVAGVATTALCAAAPPAHSAGVTTPPDVDDERLMREAIALAAQGDFPFGTVIARDGVVLERGFNSGKRMHDPTAHGEMVAIHAFLANYGPEKLKGTTLYTSGEPCPMCMGAIVWCGIGRVVYGASIEQLAAHLGQIMISCTEIAQKAPFADITITGGVLAEEAIKLFR